MANQGFDRRTALEMLAKAAIASQFPGFHRWAFGAEEAHEAAPISAQPYKPMYFSDAEYHTLDMLTDLIIPADYTPGAKEAGVSEFIDFMAAHGEKEIQQPMRDGLMWLDSVSKNAHNEVFAKLSPEQQTAILKAASRGELGPDKTTGRHFFLLIRRYTTMGYYTSRAGLKELDFPGLRLYTQSPECPHKNDPQHLHLAAPRI